MNTPTPNPDARVGLQQRASNLGYTMIHNYELARLRERADTAMRIDGLELWYWQADDGDLPESLSCPVVMSADQLRTLVGTRPPAGERTAWRPMETAPRDGRMLRLLVSFSEHATEDSAEASPTIGANNFDGTGDDDWQFAGWCWTHDHFTEGKGVPVGWLPMLDLAPPAVAPPMVTAEDIGWCEDIAAAMQEAGGPTNNMRLVALRRAIAALRGKPA